MRKVMISHRDQLLLLLLLPGQGRAHSLQPLNSFKNGFLYFALCEEPISHFCSLSRHLLLSLSTLCLSLCILSSSFSSHSESLSAAVAGATPAVVAPAVVAAPAAAAAEEDEDRLVGAAVDDWERSTLTNCQKRESQQRQNSKVWRHQTRSPFPRGCCCTSSCCAPLCSSSSSPAASERTTTKGL